MNARAFFVRTRAHETRDVSIRHNVASPTYNPRATARLFQSVKRALFKDRGDLFVHFLYVYLASASTNAIAVQAPN